MRLTYCNRLGYHSSGGFYFEYVNPLPQDKVLTFAPAYQFHFSGQKLDRKDGPLAKSGENGAEQDRRVLDRQGRGMLVSHILYLLYFFDRSFLYDQENIRWVY